VNGNIRSLYNPKSAALGGSLGAATTTSTIKHRCAVARSVFVCRVSGLFCCRVRVSVTCRSFDNSRV